MDEHFISYSVFLLKVLALGISIYSWVNHFHSIIRWLLLFGLVASLVFALNSLIARKSLNQSGQLISLLTLRIAHTQFLIGLVLYLISPRVIFSSSSMKSPVLRFFLVEHISAMLISIALITIGYSLTKKSLFTPRAVRKLFWFYLVSLIIILALIPWPFMPYGSHWI